MGICEKNPVNKAINESNGRTSTFIDYYFLYRNLRLKSIIYIFNYLLIIHI